MNYLLRANLLSFLTLLGSWFLPLGGGVRGASPVDFIPVLSAKDMVHDAQRGLLYVTNGANVERYDLASKTLLEPFVLSGDLMGIDLSPNQNRLAVTGGDAFLAGNGGLHIVDLPAKSIESVEYGLAFYEGPSFSTVFLNDSEILLSTSFNGSGTVPLRRINIDDESFEMLASVQQDTILSATPDRSRVAFFESNNSRGPYGVYSAAAKSIARSNLSGFRAEIGISRDGDKIIVANGGLAVTLVDDQLNLSSPSQHYGGSSAIGIVFSPVNDLAFVAWTPGFDRTHHILDVYDTEMMLPVSVIDAEPRLGENNSLSYKTGRLKISRDGRTLFALAYNGVYVYDVSAFAVPEPGCLTLAAGFLCVIHLCVREHRKVEATRPPAQLAVDA
jgi:DNA-binding beta-propeller fold protein YncE